MKKWKKLSHVSLECLQISQPQTNFYCCGIVLFPTEDLSHLCPFRIRHGMSFKSINSPNFVEDAKEAWDYDYETLKIVDPIVPFSGVIPQIFIGRTIEIKGKINNNAKRFAVDFVTDVKNDCDIAFHFNPRFDRRLVVRNTRRKGFWGDEEIASARPFPFVIGRNVTITIFISDGQFMVAVNNKHYCSYSFRIASHLIRSLSINGDITLSQVHHSQTTRYPNIPLSSKSPRVILPSHNKLAKVKRNRLGINVGTKIVIRGQVKMLPYEFYINLQVGSSLIPHPIIPLHINLRLCRPGLLEQQIICNSWVNGGWESEVKPLHCPFLPGMKFIMSIYYLDDGFTVYVNDVFLVGFPLRLPYPPVIDTLLVEGDVNISAVNIKKVPSSFLL